MIVGIYVRVAVTIRTRLKHNALEHAPRLLSRELDESEMSHSHDGRLDPILFEMRRKSFQHLLPMLFVVHIYKVDDDYSADIAKSQLFRYLFRRYHIRLEDRLFEIFVSNVLSRINVYDGESFRSVYYYIRAVL